MTEQPRGSCRSCGRRITVRKNGTLRDHVSNESDGNLPWRKHCSGSGSSPVVEEHEGNQP